MTGGNATLGRGIAFEANATELITSSTNVLNIGTAGNAKLGLFTNSIQRVNIDATNGDINVQTGNIVPPSAKGVNFTANTPAAGMTSQLLNWYEEGTWTPAQGPEVTVVGAYSSSATYTRIGRQVTVKIKLAGSTSIACTAFGRLLTDLPFTSAAGDAVGTLWVEGVTESRIALVSGSGTTMYATAAFGAPATQVIITATYFV